MILGDRLKAIREGKDLSQGDIEKRTGLLRCYISRVENAHTVPCVETLEKMARALEVPLYQLFYDGSEPEMSPIVRKNGHDAKLTSKDRREVARLNKKFLKLDPRDRSLVHVLTGKLAARA